jgi:hypothetical protein
MRSPPDPVAENKFYPRGSLAIALAEAGWKIIPLTPDGKTPAIAKWPDRATTDIDQLVTWWREKDYNIGIVTGSYQRSNGLGPAIPYCLVVVDYDMKDGQAGEKALFRHELDGLSDTVTSKTPHGVHKFYWATHLVPNSLSRIALNVDVRGVRGYVVAPGSTVDSVTYEWTGEFKEVAPFPDVFDALATAGKSSVNVQSQTHAKAPIGDLDRPDQIARAKAYLVNDAPEAVEGSHGDQTTYLVAATLKDFGLSEAACLDQMLLFWNEEKAFPPWAFDALRTKVSNAYRYGQNAPGIADALAEFGVEKSGLEGPTDRQKDAKGREPMVDESFDEAADSALDELANPLIEGLLGQGEISAIYGNPESGKTFAALDLCYAIADGVPEWNGLKITQGGVLYVAAEGGPTIRKRFRAIRARYGKKNVPMRLLRYPIDMRTGSFDALRLAQLVKDREQEMGRKIRLVVIDTLAESLAGGNDTEHMPQFIHNTKILKNKTGANVMVIHHPGKDTSRGPRGRSDFRGWVDTLIEVFDPKQGEGGSTSRRRFKVLRLRDYELPKHPLWFRLESVELGKTSNGVKVTSAVVVWCGSASEEFKTEMTPGDQTLFETIERWALATGNEIDDATATPLLGWLKDSEPNNIIGKTKPATLRKQLQRLREEGYLEMRASDDENKI